MIKKYEMFWDFDTPLYAACTACEDKSIIVKHINSGRTKEFKNRTTFWGTKRKEVGGWLSEQKGTWVRGDFEITEISRRNRIPLYKAKESLDSRIAFMKSQSFCKNLEIVVQGIGNFRNEIYSEYKANRPKNKPIVFTELKSWLIDKYNPIVKNGIESDDVISSIQYKKEKDVCAIYVDHDIDQCVGYKLNPNNIEAGILWNDKETAIRCLYESILSGDYGDNIPGVEGTTPFIWEKYKLKGRKYRIGKGNAKKLLFDCKTEEDMVNRVQEIYKHYYCDLWAEKLQLNFRLLKLLEDVNKLCINFPFIL